MLTSGPSWFIIIVVELLLPWFTIYSWSFQMASHPLITYFSFCFSNIGFPTKGGHAICWPKYKKKIESSFANLFTNIETMDIGHWKFHKQWMHILLKGKTSLHKVIWSLAFQSGGDMLFICPNTNDNQFTNSDNMG